MLPARAHATVVALALLLAAATPAPAAEILVHAAASLTDVLEEIGGDWQGSSGHAVLFNLGGTSDLGRQLRAGAPGDVFLSADREQMDLVERAGLVRAADRIDLLSNALVIVVPTGAPAPPRGPRDLLAVKRLTLADPEAVPAGVYARRWLASAGLWDALRGRVVPSLNVRAALAAVESENAGAAVVYRTDAATSRRVRVAFEVPREQAPPIVYVAAALAGSRHPEVARAFLRHLASPPSRAVFQRHGFVPLAGR
jgi:molybdate transport system substrate-binding protein